MDGYPTDYPTDGGGVPAWGAEPQHNPEEADW
jgi:hypothetical protein